MPRDFLSDEDQQSMDDKMPGRDFLNENLPQEQESIGGALIKAPYRISEDIVRGAYNTVKNIPNYYEAAKTEVPGALNVLKEHPAHAALQALAGSQEAINKLAQAPLGLAQYGANRLNILPKSIPKAIEKISPEDTQQSINQLFGEPQYPGENLLRGLSRNLPEIVGATGIAKIFNPLNLTSKGIAKNVIGELNDQVSKHTTMYNNLWDEAKKKGLDTVDYNKNLLNNSFDFIDKYYPDKYTSALKNFISRPSLENAQKAQSDLGILRRSIEEKSRTSPLLDTEKQLHKILSDSEKHIENNMFKDNNGNINKNLHDKYNKITNSYRENVVPYRYNSDIQSYLNKELTAKELVQRLSKGEFAAKKGSEHPALGIRNALIPFVGGVGGIGALGGGKYLYDQMMGNQPRQ